MKDTKLKWRTDEEAKHPPGLQEELEDRKFLNFKLPRNVVRVLHNKRVKSPNSRPAKQYNAVLFLINKFHLKDSQTNVTLPFWFADKAGIQIPMRVSGEGSNPENGIKGEEFCILKENDEMSQSKHVFL